MKQSSFYKSFIDKVASYKKFTFSHFLVIYRKFIRKDKQRYCLLKIKYSAIAQLVEQVTVNHWVAGSSPARGA